MKLTVALTMTLAVASLLATGCSSSPLGPDPEEPSLYLPPTSHENVLQNLMTAYMERDLEPYVSLFADEFLFYTAENDQDPSNPDPLPEYWDLAFEEACHSNMFSSDWVEEISLTLTTIAMDSTSVPDGGGGFETHYRYYEDVDLRIRTTDNWTFIASLPSRFHLRRVEAAAGRVGGSRWQIVEWHDNPYDVNHDPAERGSEDATWGSLKAMFILRQERTQPAETVRQPEVLRAAGLAQTPYST